MLRVYWKQNFRVNLLEHLPNLFSSRVPRGVRLDEAHTKMLEPVVKSLVVYQHLFIERFTKRMYERASPFWLDVDELSHAVETQVRNEHPLVLAQLLGCPSILKAQKLPLALVIVFILISARPSPWDHDNNAIVIGGRNIEFGILR